MGRGLRILSGNLLLGRTRIDEFVETLARFEPDVIALQEVTPNWVDALGDLLPHGHIEPDRNYVGMAMLTRWPVDVERVPFVWGFGQTVRIEAEHWDSGSLAVEITNLHIAAPHMFFPAPGLYLRRRQIRELDAYLARDGCGEDSRAQRPARVLVGDFNAAPYWPLYRRMASQFTDAAVEVAKQRGRAASPTWGPWPGAPKLFRIDHGFVQGLEVEDFTVFDIPGSDHRAFIMELTSPDDPSGGKASDESSD